MRCDCAIVEFRRHKEVTNPVHVIGFLSQWKIYLEGLPQGAGAEEFTGKKLDATAVEKVSMTRQYSSFKPSSPTQQQMSAEQLGQLYELMHATKDVWKPIKED